MRPDLRDACVRIALASLALVAPSARVIAQAPTLGIGGGVAHMLSNWRNESTTIRADGAAAVLEARAGIGALGVTGAYEAGRLHSGGRALSIDRGAIALSFRIGEALELSTGPVATLLRADTTATRWVEWQGSLRASQRIAASGVSTHLGLSLSRGGRDGSAGATGSAFGAVAGVSWRIGASDVRLEYGMDEMRLPAGERLTLEQIAVVVALRR